MTSNVVKLDDWRDPDRVLDVAVVRPREAHGWHDLHWIAQTDSRDAIRIYRRLGMHIHVVHGIRDGGCTCRDRHECDKPGKHPIDNGWQSAPFEFDRVDDALLKNPLLNLGWRMGPQPNGSTVICFDIDGPRELLAPLESKFGALPETLTAASARGLHYFFKLPPGAVMPTNTKLCGIKEIDIRSRGGQVVIAPSRHYSGAVYKWLVCVEPAELPL